MARRPANGSLIASESSDSASWLSSEPLVSDGPLNVDETANASVHGCKATKTQLKTTLRNVRDSEG